MSPTLGAVVLHLRFTHRVLCRVYGDSHTLTLYRRARTHALELLHPRAT